VELIPKIGKTSLRWKALIVNGLNPPLAEKQDHMVELILPPLAGSGSGVNFSTKINS
jgi:hypothetical protein